MIQIKRARDSSGSGRARVRQKQAQGIPMAALGTLAAHGG
jgi:hypothetical protein